MIKCLSCDREIDPEVSDGKCPYCNRQHFKVYLGGSVHPSWVGELPEDPPALGSGETGTGAGDGDHGDTGGEAGGGSDRTQRQWGDGRVPVQPSFSELTTFLGNWCAEQQKE